jgi:hypothetical protein
MNELGRVLAWSAAPAVLATVAIATTEGKPIAYPKGYRDYTHVKSMVIQQGHPLFEAFGGIHHIYANPSAVTGYRTGTFPDGSVIVFDLLEAPSEKGGITEGPRKVLAVMVKDRAAFGETGGWGFEGFGGGNADKRLVGANAATACFACHQAQKDRDYVFSAWRD